MSTSLHSEIAAQRKRKAERYANNVVSDSKTMTQLQASILRGVPTNTGFDVSFKASTRVHQKALAGDAITVVIKPRTVSTNETVPNARHLFWEQFTRDSFSVYKAVGINVMDELKTMTYTLSYDMTLKNLKKPHEPSFQFNFIMFPCFNGRIVTSATPDFTQVMINQPKFDMEFALMCNRHGSDVGLVSVNAVEIQFVKTGPRRKSARTWWNVPFVKRCGINVKNDDNKCFMWSILAARHFNFADSSSKSIQLSEMDPIHIRCWEKNFDWAGIEFKEDGVDYNEGPAAFEENNPGYAIHVWTRDLESKETFAPAVPVYVSPRLREPDVNHIDLYFAEDPKSGLCHYVWIHNLMEFFQPTPKLANKQRDEFLCRQCLTGFSSRHDLAVHYDRGCLSLHQTKNARMMNKGSRSSVWKTWARLQARLVVLVDTDITVLEDGTHHIKEIGYQLQVSGFEPRCPTMHVFSRGQDCEHFESESCHCVVHDFIECMLQLEKDWKEWVSYLSSESNPNKYHKLTADQIAYHNKTNECHICEKEIKYGQKHRDHCHITGHYRGPAHVTCNQNLNYVKHDLPILMSDSRAIHLVIQSLDDLGADVEISSASVNALDAGSVKAGKLQFTDSNGFLKMEMEEDTQTNLYKMNTEWWKFRSLCMKEYKLDPVVYNSLPSFAWDAALMYTKESPAHVTDPEIYKFIDESKRGAINVMPVRLHKANNPHLDTYDSSVPISYLANFDIRSSYGYSMKQPLPYDDFKFVAVEDIPAWFSLIEDDAPVGYFFKVDLKIPKNAHWQNRYDMLPLGPNHKHINGKKMLVNTHEDKLNYVVHYRLLKFYLRNGCCITKIHGAVSFNQRPWLAPFMELQERLRAAATTPSLKNTMKLITNCVFGKTITNPTSWTKNVVYRLNNDKGLAAFERGGVRSNTVCVRKISDNLLTSMNVTEMATMNTPVAVGCTILELGKLQLYSWYYEKLVKAQADVKLLYADTDSLICTMTMDPNELIAENPDWFDERVGSLKDENEGEHGTIFIGAKPKHYLYHTTGTKEVKIAGLSKSVAGTITVESFMDVIDNQTSLYGSTSTITKKDHVLQKVTSERKFMDAFDNSRHYFTRYQSRAHGHVWN